MDAADVVRWSRDLTRRETQHLLCCSPESGPCNLRTVESERRRMGPPEWARFQIAAHVRADVQVAMGELWPVTEGLDWEHLRDDEIRALPELPAALWALIIRGPGNQAERTPLPANQMPKSRFGFVSERAAERILRHNWRVINATIGEAIGLMTDWLNGPTGKQLAYRYEPGIACRPGVHEFSIDGSAPTWLESRCLCGRVTYIDHLLDRAVEGTPFRK